MRRVRAWRFSYGTPEADLRQRAVRAAARFLGDRASELPDGAVPTNPTQRAALALELHEHFLGRDSDGALEVVVPEVAALRAAIERRASAPPLKRARARG
jgi:hypothetical protein